MHRGSGHEHQCRDSNVPCSRPHPGPRTLIQAQLSQAPLWWQRSETALPSEYGVLFLLGTELAPSSVRAGYSRGVGGSQCLLGLQHVRCFHTIFHLIRSTAWRVRYDPSFYRWARRAQLGGGGDRGGGGWPEVTQLKYTRAKQLSSNEPECKATCVHSVTAN